MPGSMWMRFAAALVTVVSVVSCSSATHAPASAAKSLSAWTPCPLTESSPTPLPELECAAITVPMDYGHPDGPTFTVPLIRIPSKAAKPRLLMTNPGGPGISGVSDLRSAATYFEKLTDTYTVVSFDPRGVGASAPAIACIDAEQKSAIFNQPSVPVTPQQQERATELAKGIGESCNRQFGEALGHVGTADVVRDMDAVREAMGFDKISYIGYSYGTFVGALYADAYPNRVDRLVLDSVLDPKLTYEQVRHGQAQGLQASVAAFVDDCLTLPDCPLSGPKEAALQKIEGIVRDLDAQMVTTAGGRELSGARMLALIESSMYFPDSGWPALRTTLRQAIAGDWVSVVDSAYSPDLMVNPADSEYLSVVCIDFQTERDAAAPARLAPVWAKESPLSGGSRAWSLQPCENWPVQAVRRPGPVRAEGAGPALILNMSGDPATPLAWAESLHEQLTGSSLVIAPGQGHIASSHNKCADAATLNFLEHGTLPATATFNCPADG